MEYGYLNAIRPKPNKDTAGEVIFETASTLTHQVFNGLLHMNRAYLRLRQQYQQGTLLVNSKTCGEAS
jgi:hypothetical protein